ncbi:hypothetical protein GCM10029978_066570 [Actinoallomurus acanthiterrae]
MALVGLGGTGKSTLAAAAAHSPLVRGRFRGRFRQVTWLAAGPSVDPLSLLIQLGHRLGDENAVYPSVSEARDAVTTLLDRSRLLIVLDDVWNDALLRAFTGLGATSLLFTTRNRDLARAVNARQIAVDELTREQALALLERWTSGQPVSESDARALCARLGDLALGIAMAGAMIARGRLAQEVIALVDRDLERISGQFVPAYRYGTLRAAIDAGIDDLPLQVPGEARIGGRLRDRYLELAVFAGRGAFPRSATEALWADSLPDPYALSEALEEFCGRSLLSGSDDWFIAHDLQYDAMSQHPDAPDFQNAHRRLITGWRTRHPAGWVDAAREDRYISENLAWHLHQAGETDPLADLLADPRWMLHRISTASLPELLVDYAEAPTSLTRAIRRALAISTTALALSPGFLTSQLAGRLLGHPDSTIDAWAANLTPPHSGRWIAPLTSDSLTPVTSPLEHILAAHAGRVSSVAFSPDSAHLATGSHDGTVWVWDLATGEGVSAQCEQVRSVAYSPDGTQLTVVEKDLTVRLWDLATGQETTLTGHEDPVTAVAHSPNGSHVATGDDSGAVRVRDLSGGRYLTLAQPSVSTAAGADRDPRLRSAVPLDLLTGLQPRRKTPRCCKQRRKGTDLESARPPELHAYPAIRLDSLNGLQPGRNPPHLQPLRPHRLRIQPDHRPGHHSYRTQRHRDRSGIQPRRHPAGHRKRGPDCPYLGPGLRSVPHAHRAPRTDIVDCLQS